MSQNIVLLIALAVIIFLLVALRVNAALVFLSLCLGAVLVQYVAGQANDLLNLISPKLGSASDSSVKLALLALPAVITMVVTVCSVQGKVKVALNILPAVASGALAVLLAVPLLPPHIASGLQSQEAWHYLSNCEALVVSSGAFVSLMFLWSQRNMFKRRKHGH